MHSDEFQRGEERGGVISVKKTKMGGKKKGGY
jgi:hypothetical protein